MAEHRLRAEWEQTAEILAMTYNMHRPAKTKAMPGWRLNPLGERPRRSPAKLPHQEAWAMFRTVFDRGVFGGRK